MVFDGVPVVFSVISYSKKRRCPDRFSVFVLSNHKCQSYGQIFQRGASFLQSPAGQFHFRSYNPEIKKQLIFGGTEEKKHPSPTQTKMKTKMATKKPQAKQKKQQRKTQTAKKPRREAVAKKEKSIKFINAALMCGESDEEEGQVAEGPSNEKDDAEMQQWLKAHSLTPTEIDQLGTQEVPGNCDARKILQHEKNGVFRITELRLMIPRYVHGFGLLTGIEKARLGSLIAAAKGRATENLIIDPSRFGSRFGENFGPLCAKIRDLIEAGSPIQDLADLTRNKSPCVGTFLRLLRAIEVLTEGQYHDCAAVTATLGGGGGVRQLFNTSLNGDKRDLGKRFALAMESHAAALAAQAGKPARQAWRQPTQEAAAPTNTPPTVEIFDSSEGKRKHVQLPREVCRRWVRDACTRTDCRWKHTLPSGWRRVCEGL